MKGTTTHNLKYTGTVTLSQYIGESRHIISITENAGGPALFDFLADCLIGNFNTAQLNRPSKIMLLERDGSTLRQASVNAGFFWLINRPEKLDIISNPGTIRYSFTLPSDAITNNVTSVGLYTRNAEVDNLNDYAAISELKFDFNNISSSAALLIDWELKISNKE